jgi:hypothetical protein
MHHPFAHAKPALKSHFFSRVELMECLTQTSKKKARHTLICMSCGLHPPLKQLAQDMRVCARGATDNLPKIERATTENSPLTQKLCKCKIFIVQCDFTCEANQSYPRLRRAKWLEI